MTCLPKKVLCAVIMWFLLVSFGAPQVFALESGHFEVHYIDVGQADAALILCDGHAMLVDGGNVENSSLIYAYLKEQSITHLDFIICTHPHEDHVGGLAGALNYADVDVAYCPVKEYDSKAFRSFVKYLARDGVEISVPKTGDVISLGGASITFMAPISLSDNVNNMSIVVRVVYGDTSFLFTGDAEREEEQDMLASRETLASTVVKIGHHGSDTSTSYLFLREVMPKYAVISVGKSNSYGHPSDDVLSRLHDAGAMICRTDLDGDIVFASDGETVKLQGEREPR